MDIRQITVANIKRMRGDMTQESLANHLGVKKQNIYALEKGLRPLTDKTLELLCEIFACNPEEFYKVGNSVPVDELDKLLLEEISKMERPCKAELYAKSGPCRERPARQSIQPHYPLERASQDDAIVG